MQPIERQYWEVKHIIDIDLTVKHVVLFVVVVFIGVVWNEKTSNQHVFKKMNKLTVEIVELGVSPVVTALVIVVLVRLADESIYNA
jgi:preprotein translocase subunit SecY